MPGGMPYYMRREAEAARLHMYEQDRKKNKTNARKNDTIQEEGKEMFKKTYTKEINGKWYAFGGDRDGFTVYSIGLDIPKGSLGYTAKGTEAGVEYVATPSASKEAAKAKARRAGEYGGEW